MISFVILLSCILLRAQSLEDYCFALGRTVCEYEFLCLDDGSKCDADENAEVSYTPISCASTGKTDCSDGIYSYYNGATNVNVYYTISNWKTFANIDTCSIDYAISIDLDGAAYCDATLCGMVNYGVDAAGASIDACFEYCYAHPEACLTNPCPSDSGSVCCATQSSYYCTDYCAVQQKGTSENCCGGPATYASVNTDACTGYFNNHLTGTFAQSYLNCKSNSLNLTACALCTSYYTCCSQYKSKATTLSAAICDDFCALKPADADCEKRKKCLESLGHPPSEAELAKCGTSIARLSSFTVAVLLGVMAFFFLV